MSKYPKINGLYKRDMNKESPNYGKFIEGNWSIPEFEYLANNQWIFTEKIDGTNIRIIWDGFNLEIKGRTDRAEIPKFLLAKLNDIFTIEKFKQFYQEQPIILYGEGYGARIQGSGGNYIKDGVDFILFDVRIGNWWLKREGIEEVAEILDLKTVPIIGEGTLYDGINLIKKGLKSQWGDFLAEGVVAKTKLDLLARNGKRIITKIKHKDFQNKENKNG
jgi:ATP-dependent RNA circularization protein (DNA/RNA ligase family)